MKAKQKLLLPTNDFVFKKVFAEHTALLGSLLAALSMRKQRRISCKVLPKIR